MDYVWFEGTKDGELMCVVVGWVWGGGCEESFCNIRVCTAIPSGWWLFPMILVGRRKAPLLWRCNNRQLRRRWVGRPLFVQKFCKGVQATNL